MIWLLTILLCSSNQCEMTQTRQFSRGSCESQAVVVAVTLRETDPRKPFVFCIQEAKEGA